MILYAEFSVVLTWLLEDVRGEEVIYAMTGNNRRQYTPTLESCPGDRSGDYSG